MTAAELNLAFAREVAGSPYTFWDYTKDWNAVLAQIHKRGLEWEKNHSSWLPERKSEWARFRCGGFPKRKSPLDSGMQWIRNQTGSSAMLFVSPPSGVSVQRR